MKTQIHQAVVLLIMTMLISVGCSNSASQIVLPVDNTANANPTSEFGLLGIFNLSIDADKSQAELTPIRGSSLTDVLEIVDITNFLKVAPCTDCVRLRGVSHSPDGELVLTIGVKHPFIAGDPLAPISGRNRADLHVFNVEGTIVSNNTAVTYPSLGAALADVPLVNADGYSAYLDASLDSIYPTTATIHPYVLHFDDYTAGNFSAGNPSGFLSVTDPPPSGNLVMAMGCDYNYQDYRFNLEPGDVVNYIYAVGCTYAVSAAKKQYRFTPEYRIPQHNKKAASEVTLEITDNELIEGDAGSTANLEIRVVDISHGVAVGSALDQMLSDSSVDEIEVEIPSVMTSPVIVDGSTPVSGTGHSPSDPLLYNVTITNTADAATGIYAGLVCVKDSYAPGQNTAGLLNGMDGIERVSPVQNPLEGLFAISEFCTYQTFSVFVDELIPIIYVDNSNTGPVFDGTKANPYNTIQAGIDACPVGWEVHVDDSGTPYAEQVNMKSDIPVISANWDDTDGDDRATIDGPDTTGSYTVNFYNVSNATISGFQLDFCAYSGTPGFMKIVNVQGGSSNTVRNCLFTGTSTLGRVRCVNILDADDTTIEYCAIQNIDFNATNLVFFTGIYANATTPGINDGLTIKNNRISRIANVTHINGDSMVMVDMFNTDNVVYQNNLICHIVPNASGASSMVEGFSTENCPHVTVINNTIDDINVTNAFSIQQAFAYNFTH
jgi:hypothetical protein